jgi:16S rRNA G966 N2-methylase RsmD
MIYNDLDLSNWSEIDINVDSLWLIGERDKSGKHSNMYHGNFIPQIPNQLIRRYTKKGDIILDSFMGSGTTLFECEKLDRKFIGFDINSEILQYVQQKMIDSTYKDYSINECNVINRDNILYLTQKALNSFGKDKLQFAIMHPPYMDIVKFTSKEEDLSQISDLSLFVKSFIFAVGNTIEFLATNRYFAVVIGDVYKNSEVIPLGFYVMDAIKRKFKVKLKGIIVKNIEGNRGKLGKGGIWRYRALKSDYYIFKHEYIFIFKKEF